MKKKVETSETLREGNRVSSRNARSQSIQRLYFTSAIFNYDLETVRQALEPIAKKLIIGNEICPSTGRQHFQTFIATKRKMRAEEITKRFPNGGVKLLPCFAGEAANTKYCSKDKDVYTYEWKEPEKNPSEIIRKNCPTVESLQRILLDWGSKPNSIFKFNPETLEQILLACQKTETNPYDILVGFVRTELEDRDTGAKLLKAWRK